MVKVGISVYVFKIKYIYLHPIYVRNGYIMANEIKKVDDEIKWGSVLGIMQRDMDKSRGMLSMVVRQIGDRMERRKKELYDKGVVEPAFDGEYNCCFQLYNQLGGIYTMLQGVDGVITSTVMEMLRDLDIDSQSK